MVKKLIYITFICVFFSILIYLIIPNVYSDYNVHSFDYRTRIEKKESSIIQDSYMKQTGISIDSSDLEIVGSWNGYGICKTIIVQNSLAYVGMGNYLVIFDVTDPSLPVRKGYYQLPKEARSISINGNYAYIAIQDMGLYIIDISNPLSPAYVSQYDTPGNAECINIAGNIAYIADGEAGLLVIDISNPSVPSLISSIDTPGYAQDIFIHGNSAFLADGSAGVEIIDISNPNLLSETGNLTTHGNAINIKVLGSYAYVLTSLEFFEIFDVSTIDAPIYKNYTKVSGQHFFLSGNLAFVLGGDQLEIINISDPDNLTKLGSTGFSEQNYSLFVIGNYCYLAGGKKGIIIIDISSPSSLDIVGSYGSWVSTNTLDVSVSGEYAFIISDYGLWAIDISDPTIPYDVGYLDGEFNKIFIKDNIAYVIGNELNLIDINDPSNLQIINSFGTSQRSSLFVSGDYAYLVGD